MNLINLYIFCFYKINRMCVFIYGIVKSISGCRGMYNNRMWLVRDVWI